MPTLGAYLLIGAVAALTTFATTFLVRRLAVRRGWVYLPSDRTVHETALPDVGGLALYTGFVVSFCVAWSIGAFDSVFDRNSEPIGVLLAATIVFAVGFVDDIRGLSPPAKVAGTVVAGLVLVWFGVVMFAFRLPYLGVTVLSDDLKPLVTVLWLVGMTTVVNLIDGLDGLASGVVAIGAFAFFLYSQELTQMDLLGADTIGPLVAIIAVGVCLGFLPHNFNPARIMMGDGGALLLGLLMAVATSVVGGRADPIDAAFVGQTYFFLAPIAIPLLILGVPIFDTVFAIVRRAASGRAFAVADKGHLHHRLMDLGHGHRRSVLILWAWTALLSGFVLYPVLTNQNPTYLPFALVALGIMLYTVLHPSVRRARSVADSAHPTVAARRDTIGADGVGGAPATVRSEPAGSGNGASPDRRDRPERHEVDGVFAPPVGEPHAAPDPSRGPGAPSQS